MFHVVIGRSDGYIVNCHTLKDAVKEAQKLLELCINDLHRDVEVHVVDEWDRIVW